MRQLFLFILTFGLVLSSHSLSCTFLIATGNAGVLVATSPEGTTLSDPHRAELEQIEKTLNTAVSVLLAQAPRLENPWPMLEALKARQNFFGERSNEFWTAYNKGNKTWSSAESKRQFLLFNSRALEDLQGILNVLSVLNDLHRDFRLAAEHVITTDTLASVIIAKFHRQLAAQGEVHISKGIYEIVVTPGEPAKSFEALFWDVELPSEEMSSHLAVAQMPAEQLASNRVRYILVPRFHLRLQAPKQTEIRYDAATRQLHFLMPLAAMMKHLPKIEGKTPGVPFRISPAH